MVLVTKRVIAPADAEPKSRQTGVGLRHRVSIVGEIRLSR